MKIIKLNCSIEEQLKLEKELLRASGNFCIFNEPTETHIVKGVLSKEEIKSEIPEIRRFSGGGTVVIDPNCLMVSFICDTDRTIFSKEIIEWGYEFYKRALEVNKFFLKENDFTIENSKVAGNALYIKREKYLLHSSFLWDYDEHLMNLLPMPIKQPKYRENRTHGDFLTKLKDHLKEKQEFFEKIEKLIKSELIYNEEK